jgi:hypothetical protein
MIDDTSTYIDTFALPSLTNVSPFLIVCCPSGGDTVGLNFTAVLSIQPPEMGVSSCQMVPHTTSSSPIGPVSSSSAGNIFRFDFSVPSGEYDLQAVPLPSGPPVTVSDLTAAVGGQTCTNATIHPDATNPRLTGIAFRRLRPTDGSGTSKPLTLYGMVPADFIVGGPAAAGDVGLEVTLVQTDAEGNLVQVIDNGNAEVADNRWSRSVYGVQAGNYLLKVMLNNILLQSLPINIQALQPGVITPVCPSV